MKWWREQFSTGYHDSKGDLNITPGEAALIVAILSAGTFIGALGAAPFADHIGRRLSLMLAVGVFAVGCILQTIALQIPIFVVGRFVLLSIYNRMNILILLSDSLLVLVLAISRSLFPCTNLKWPRNGFEEPWFVLINWPLQLDFWLRLSSTTSHRTLTVQPAIGYPSQYSSSGQASYFSG